MKRLFIVFGLLAVSLVGVQTAAAQDSEPVTTISQEKITKIRDHCIENQAALNRLHQTDLFLRNDRGELYQTISEKLMVPFSRRLATNQVDGGTFVDLAATFKTEYSRFNRAFIDYDNAITRVLSVKCLDEPVTFYNELLEARQRRDALAKSNQALMEIIRKYGTAFADYKTAFEQRQTP